MLFVHQYPRLTQKSSLYTAKVFCLNDDKKSTGVDVLWSKVGDFINVEFDEPIVIEVTVHQEKDVNPDTVKISPLRLGIKSEVEGRTIKFVLDAPGNYKIEMPGLNDLFIFGYLPESEQDIPDASDPNVIFYKAGQVYEVGKLVVKENQTVYIQGGAIVKGVIHASGADNLTIKGHGILDGSYFVRGVDKGIHTVQIEASNNVLIQDITIMHQMLWTVVLGKCDGVVIRNVKELGFEMSSDGVDICGCRNVLIEKCCFKVNDDCVVIKAYTHKEQLTVPWDYNVENILVRDCMFGTVETGAIMEIGHELDCELVSNVVFEDIDVVGQHGFGSVFSIRNTSRANINNITFKDIRIEHCYAKLIDFRVMDSRYAQTVEKGIVSDITIKNVDWNKSQYNVGYTLSTIGGLDSDHIVKNVTIEDFRINGKKATKIDDLEIFTMNAENIVVK